VHYLKKASTQTAADQNMIRPVVKEILDAIQSGGEEVARDYANRFDSWEGEIVVSQTDIAEAGTKLSEQARQDIAFVHQRIKTFAQAQRDSMQDIEITQDGVIMGHKHLPVNTAGCYVPGGRYAHIASAIMSITTAKVAGVKHVIACSPAKAGEGIHPAILYTMDLCGADSILALGGVQGVAALANGLFTGHKADILVGPGNAYVAEAKRLLFGQVGIDLFAGPTESAIIADSTADPHLVATDLVSQAEHGPDSPVWLFTTSRAVAEAVLEQVPVLIEQLPEIAQRAASTAWQNCAEVILCDSREEVVAISDQYGSEHLQVLAEDLAWWHANLTTYGGCTYREIWYPL